MSSIHITFWVNKKWGKLEHREVMSFWASSKRIQLELTQCFRSWRLETQHSELIT